MSVGRQVADAYIDVNGDTTSFRQSLNKLGAIIKKQQKQLDAQARQLSKQRAAAMNKDVDGHTSTMERVFRRMFNSIGKDHDGLTSKMSKNLSKMKTFTDGAITKMQGSWRRMDGTVRLVLTLIAAGADQMATLGSGLGASVTAMISSIGMAMANIIPLMATIPAWGLGIALLVSAIKSIKAAGGEAAIALEGIGKAYRDTLVPAFTKEVEGALTNFAKNLTAILDDPELGKALGKAFSGIIQGFADVLDSEAMGAFMDAMKDELPRAVEGFGRGFAKTFQGLISLMAGAAPAAERLGNAFEAWGTRFSESMERMRKDGTLERVFDTAYTSGAALMQLTGALGRSMGVLFMIGAKHGDELFISLANVTDQFTAYMRTAEGQKAVNEWFSNGTRIIKAMEPLLVGTGRGMALLVSEESIRRWEQLNIQMGEFIYYTSDVLRSIGKLDILGSLAALLNGIAKAISAIGQPLDVLSETLGRTLRFVVDKISELLMVVSPIVSNMLAALNPGIAALAQLFEGAFSIIIEVAAHAARILGQLLTPALNSLSTIIQGAVPWFEKVGKVLGDSLTKAGGTSSYMIDALAKTLGALVMAFGAVLKAISPLLEVLIGGLAYAIEVVGEVIGALGINAESAITGGLGSFVLFLEGLSPIISDMAVMLADVLGGAVEMLVGYYAGLAEAIGSVMPFLTSLAGAIGGYLMEAINRLAPTLDAIFKAFETIGKVIFEQVIPALGPALFGVIFGLADAFVGMSGPISALISSLVNLSTGILSNILPLAAPLLSFFGGTLIGAMEALAPAISNVAQFISYFGRVISSDVLPIVGDLVTNVLGSLGKTLTQDIFPAVGYVIDVLTDMGRTILENVIPAITPFLGALRDNLGPIVESVGGIIGAIIPVLMDVAKALLDELIPAIAPVIERFLEFGSDVLPKIQPVLEFISSAIGALAPVLIAAASIIGSTLGNIIGFVLDLFDGIIKIISGLMNNDLSTIIDGVTDIFGGLLDFIKNVVMDIGAAIAGMFFSADLVQAGTDMINGLIEGIGSAMTLLNDKIIEVGTSILTAIKEFFGIHSPSTVFAEIGGFLLQGLVEGISAGIEFVVSAIMVVGEAVMTAIGTAFAAVGQTFNDVWNGALTIVSTAWDAILAFVSTSVESISAVVTAVFTAIGTFIDNAVSNVQRVTTSVWDAIKNTWSSTLESIKTTVTTVFSAIGSFIDGAITNIRNTVESVLRVVGSIFTNTFNSVKSTVSGAFDTIRNTISNVINSIRNTVGNVLDGIRDIFSNTWDNVRNTVGGAFGQIANSVSNGINNVVNLVWSLPGRAVSALGDMASTMYSSGYNMMVGFINGVRSMAGEIANSALSAVGNAVSAVKNFLGIRSPSRLFTTLGKFTGEGFAIGMDQMQSTISRASENMASIATEAFDKSRMYIAGQDAASGLADGLSASQSLIKGALDSITGDLDVNTTKIKPVMSPPSSRDRDEAASAVSGVTLAAGAITISTPTESPRLIALEVVDELTRFSSL